MNISALELANLDTGNTKGYWEFLKSAKSDKAEGNLFEEGDPTEGEEWRQEEPQGSQLSTGQETAGPWTEAEDPQDVLDGSMGSESGVSVKIAEILSAGAMEEKKTICYGIDVARYQGTIDWGQVAGAGVSFAIIRLALNSYKV